MHIRSFEYAKFLVPQFSSVDAHLNCIGDMAASSSPGGSVKELGEGRSHPGT